MPGRESRIDEPASRDLKEVVDGVVAELPPSIGRGDIFWGASLGGIVAFEVLRALRRLGRPLPQLVISGSVPPHLSKLWQKRELARMMMSKDTNTDAFLAMMGYVDNAEFIRPIIEATRMDAPFISNYQFEPETVLETSITAFAGRRDDLVYPDDVEAWGMFGKSFKFIEVEGNHFFVHQNEALIRKTLEDIASL
jgi:surfactin synthase thioesterase subunit